MNWNAYGREVRPVPLSEELQSLPTGKALHRLFAYNRGDTKLVEKVPARKRTYFEAGLGTQKKKESSV